VARLRAGSGAATVLIVVSFVLAQDPPQMVLVPDEGAVQEFAAASSDRVGLEYTIVAVACVFS
jgi:hypothetical protein